MPTAKKPAAKKTTVKKAAAKKAPTTVKKSTVKKPAAKAPAPTRVPNTFKAGLLIIVLGVCLLGGFGLYFLLKK